MKKWILPIGRWSERTKRTFSRGRDKFGSSIADTIRPTSPPIVCPSDWLGRTSLVLRDDLYFFFLFFGVVLSSSGCFLGLSRISTGSWIHYCSACCTIGIFISFYGKQEVDKLAKKISRNNEEVPPKSYLSVVGYQFSLFLSKSLLIY